MCISASYISWDSSCLECELLNVVGVAKTEPGDCQNWSVLAVRPSIAARSHYCFSIFYLAESRARAEDLSKRLNASVDLLAKLSDAAPGEVVAVDRETLSLALPSEILPQFAIFSGTKP